MTDSARWMDAVLRLRQPLQPMATDVVAELRPLPSVHAVIFDIYGTLVISGSGDVGSADTTDRGAHITAALEATGLLASLKTVPTIEMLHEAIRRFNDLRRSEACPKPEVDIVEVWRQLLDRCGLAKGVDHTRLAVQIAAEYEARANPTWPMPGASELLDRLKLARWPMGIVSNAQIFTPCLITDLFENHSLFECGFDLDLCVFSNRFRQAKPGPRLFDVLREGLARRRILPHEAVYVGNDMLNDVWSASQAGLRTAWFAGDRRSCRRREDDPRCRSLRPDVVLTDLGQLLECLAID